MHLRVADDIEELGLDMDQFDDEVIGEWGLFDTEEGHARRASMSNVVHGVAVGGTVEGATRGEMSKEGKATTDDSYSQ